MTIKDGDKYPWTLWTDGYVHEAQEFVDFDIEPEHFRNTLHLFARKHGMRVHTSTRKLISGFHVVRFQFYYRWAGPTRYQVDRWDGHTGRMK